MIAELRIVIIEWCAENSTKEMGADKWGRWTKVRLTPAEVGIEGARDLRLSKRKKLIDNDQSVSMI